MSSFCKVPAYTHFFTFSSLPHFHFLPFLMSPFYHNLRHSTHTDTFYTCLFSLSKSPSTSFFTFFFFPCSLPVCTIVSNDLTFFLLYSFISFLTWLLYSVKSLPCLPFLTLSFKPRSLFHFFFSMLTCSSTSFFILTYVHLPYLCSLVCLPGCKLLLIPISVILFNNSMSSSY